MEGEEGVMTPGFCPGHPGGCFAFGGEMIDAYCFGGFEEAVPPHASRVHQSLHLLLLPCRVLQRILWTDSPR